MLEGKQTLIPKATTRFGTRLSILSVTILILAGCATSQQGQQTVSQEQARKQHFARMIDRHIRRQQETGLTLKQVSSPVECMTIKDGVPWEPRIQVDVEYLVLSSERTDGLLCDGQTASGNTVRFVARNQAAEAALESAGQGKTGVGLEQKNGSWFINGIIPDGPADRSKRLHKGDRILGVAEGGDSEFTSLENKSLSHVIALITGEPGTTVRLAVLRKGGVKTREVSLERAQTTPAQMKAYRKKAVRELVIEGNGGQFVSPYTSDGVVAEWVDKAINAKMGSATGSAVGAAAGSAVASKALENVPGGALLGGIAGSQVGKEAGRDAAVKASGGEAYMRRTSDLSFKSVNDMARWLVTVHGQKRNFTEVINATSEIYPELKPAIQQVQAH